MATAPFDRVCIEMDRKWGVDRLPELVSPQTAERWGLALANLNAAIAANDPALTTARVAACLRGLAVMDAEAEAAGHKPSDPDIWEYDLDGFRFGVIAEGREWRAAEAKRPGLVIFNMREVALALKASRVVNAVVEAAKQNFPGAQIVNIKPTKKDFDDEIPF